MWVVTSHFVAHVLSWILDWLLVALRCLLPRLPNLAWTLLQKDLNPLSPNPLGIMNIFQRQPHLESLHKICNHWLPRQGSISQLFQTVLSLYNGPMLLLQKPSLPYFLPLAESTKVGLPHPFGKLREGEFHMFQADSGFAFGPTQVWRISTPIICIVFVIRNIWCWRKICNPCNICPPQVCSQLKLFHWVASGESHRCTKKFSWCSSRQGCQPNDWNVLRGCWWHLSCAWKWRPMSGNLPGADHLRSTITFSGEIICFPWWPKTWISLGCTSAWL